MPPRISLHVDLSTTHPRPNPMDTRKVSSEFDSFLSTDSGDAKQFRQGNLTIPYENESLLDLGTSQADQRFRKNPFDLHRHLERVSVVKFPCHRDGARFKLRGWMWTTNKVQVYPVVVDRPNVGRKI